MIDAAPAARRDLTAWYYAAAVFWFEACGLLLVSAMVVMSPFACWGDPIDPMRFESPCARGQNPAYGTIATLLAALIAVGVATWLIWVVTVGRPRRRGIACLVLGLVALAPIVIVALIDLAFLPVPTVWTGVPALLLLGSAWRRLRPQPK